MISEYTWHSRIRRAMTCVYCEPKSRIRIFEYVGGSEVFTLRMCLLHAVVHRRVVRGPAPVHWPKRPLPGNAAPELLLHFLSAALFDRVRAPAQSQQCDGERNRKGLHLLIL